MYTLISISLRNFYAFLYALFFQNRIYMKWLRRLRQEIFYAFFTLFFTQFLRLKIFGAHNVGILKIDTFLFLCRFSAFLGNHFPNYFFQPSNLIFCAILRLFIFEKFDTRTFCMEKKKSAITQTLTQPDASGRLFTRAEVAEYLNIGTTFIEQLRRQGKLPSYRLSGKCIRYKKSDCDVLLDHCFIVRPAKSAKKGEI